MPKQAYEDKFKEFIRLCAEAQAQGIEVVVIHHPEVLGDTSAEIVESLNRLAGVGLALRILPPGERGKPK